MWTASEALPVRTNTQPWFIIPNAFQNKAPFSSAKATSFIAIARLLPRNFRSGYRSRCVNCSANIKVAAWPISRASLSAWSASASAASG